MLIDQLKYNQNLSTTAVDFTFTKEDGIGYLSVITSTNIINVFLPEALDYVGRMISVVKGDAASGYVRINKQFSNLIVGKYSLNSQSEYHLLSQYEGVSFLSDGVNWVIVDTLGMDSIVGEVKALFTNTAPTGYLLCDGTQISRTTYARLYAVVGNNCGSGDGANTFHLPDLRGRFLRGVDGSAGRDPDKLARTVMNSGGNSGVNVGSVQAHATAKNGLSNASSSVSGTVGGSDGSHTHGTTEVAHSHTFSVNAGSAQSQWTTYALGNAGIAAWFDDNGSVPPVYNLTPRTIDSASTGLSVNNTGSTHGHTFTLNAAAQTITGDAETRPINAYVNYFIKF